ncbi:MAG: GtrA family protein [Anaerolineales bacterium]|nr:GtrA family protein [Anaerolineales bacterium]
MTTIKRTLPYPVWLEQAAKFLSVGILNTALDASLYFVLTRWPALRYACGYSGQGFSTLQTLAKGISYGAGILNSFYWNKSWTFKSDGAMIDTEFLAGARARGFRIAEAPVTHLPRVAGEATGANFKVIAKAFRDLVGFRRRLRQELREEKRAELCKAF